MIMIRVILTGCCGKMGHNITDAVSARDDMEICAGLDLCKCDYSYPVFSSLEELKDIPADVVIDFSNPALTDSLIEFCRERKLALIECTTGLSESQKAELVSLSETVPVFSSGNMSLGINLLIELSKAAAKVLGDNFDIEIVEAHHNLKIDAPSGTAYMIADAINDELDEKASYEYNRHDKREKRPKNEIGIHSIRGGTIVGEHEVIFAGNDEILKISHSARSKALFATGAVNAAAFIIGKNAGMYTMSDMIKEG